MVRSTSTACALLFSVLVNRHEVFRTRFTREDGETVQYFDAPSRIDLPITDFSTLDVVESERALRKHVVASLTEPYDLEKGLYFAVACTCCGRARLRS